MFRNPANALWTIFALAIATPGPALGCPVDGIHFATDYLHSSGRIMASGDEPGSPELMHQSVTQETFEIAARNNVCVSLVLTQQFESAKRSCQRALNLGVVKLERRDANDSPTDTLTMLATIYSNLGVANALSGNASDARAYFDDAHRLDPQHQATKHNLAALTVHRSSMTARLAE